MENQSPAQSSGQIYPPQNQPVAPQPPVQPVNSSSVPPPTESQGLPPYVPPSNKKRIFVIVGAIIALLVIIAIVAIVILSMSSKKNQGDVTLTYWGLWEDESVYKEVIDEFERQNPHIKVKYEKQDIQTIGKYMDRLNARINKGDGPDIYRFHNSWVPQLTSSSLLAPFPNSFLNATQYTQQNYPFVKNDMQVNGAYYGVPLGIDTLAMFVNEDLFTNHGVEPPTTWEDLQSVSRKITVKDADTGQITTSGVALGTFDNIAHASDIISMLMVQNGADLRNLAGPQKVNAEQAMQFYISFAAGDNAVWNNEMENSKLAFSEGKLAMYFGYSWDIPEIKAKNPNLKFSVMTVPHLPGRDQTIASYWVEGVSSKTKYPDQSFLFLQFLAKPESIEKIYAAEAKQRGQGVPYPRIDQAKLLANNQLLYPFVEQAPTAVSTIFSSDTFDEGYVTALNGYLANGVNKILNDSLSIESAIGEIAQGVTQVFNGGK
jgi:multiple sugar transport system substrate-binding protein